MKLDEVYKQCSMILEYSKNKGMSLSYQGGKKADGKSFDRIASGITKPYKTQRYVTKYEKSYPNLSNLINKLKTSSIKGNIIVLGKSLEELKTLMNNFNLKLDKTSNNLILPFGDNVRLIEMNGNYYVSYDKNKEEDSLNTIA